MSTIHGSLSTLASKFADDVLAAIRTASLSDLLESHGTASHARPARSNGSAKPSPAKALKAENGRLARRGPEEIGKVVTSIVSLLAKNPAGMRAEQIRGALNLQSKEMPRPLAEALKQKLITSKGQKRATTYSVKSTSGSKTAKKPSHSAKKPAAKKSKK
jgi:hypothetical protein